MIDLVSAYFVFQSNDKMELATQLTTTEHAKREMEEEIEKHEVSLSLIKEEVSCAGSVVEGGLREIRLFSALKFLKIYEMFSRSFSSIPMLLKFFYFLSKISTKDKTVTELQNALLQAQLHVQSSPQQPNSSNINDGLRMELTTSQETVSILG